MVDIFISYKKERRAHAQRLAIIFEARGYDVWWDHSLIVGDTFRDQIEEKLVAARAVITLWCTGSVQSRFVRSESARAEKSSKLIQAYLEPVQAPIGMDEAQGQSLLEWRGAPDDTHLSGLLAPVERLVGRPRRSVPNLMEALSALLPPLPRVEPIVAIDETERADGLGLPGESAVVNDRESVFFQACTTADDFEAYLGQYPEGHFAQLAQSRIAHLDSEWISSLGLTPEDWTDLDLAEILAKLGGRASRADLVSRARRRNAIALTLLAMRFDDAGDFEEAFSLYSQAAELGFPRAQSNLGLLYYRAQGVPKDNTKASEWFRRAAEQGLARGQYNYGRMLEGGLGVGKDLSAAEALYKKAMAQGEVNSPRGLERIEMEKARITAAKRARVPAEKKPDTT